MRLPTAYSPNISKYRATASIPPMAPVKKRRREASFARPGGSTRLQIVLLRRRTDRSYP